MSDWNDLAARGKEHIRAMLGKIGGRDYSRRDTIINIIFPVIILTLLVLEMTTHSCRSSSPSK